MVKVYNVKTLIEANCKGYTSYNKHKLAIIQGPKGVVISDDEAIHTIFEKNTEHYEISVVKLPENPNEVNFFPDAVIQASIIQIQGATYEEMELGKFVRKFASRLESNYRILLNSLKEIGLNPEDHPRDFDK